MNIAVACGGTGGHIFPGLATAEVLQKRGHDVTLWLSGRDVESLSVGSWTGGMVRIKSSGVARPVSLGAAKSIMNMAGAVFSSIRAMRTARPQRLLAMGSYASVGPVLAARYLNVPIVLHEANVIPGRAISFLARYSSVVATGFAETAGYFKHQRVVCTGMPLRAAITDAAAKVSPSGGTGACILVMGGSQGAHRVNELAAEAVCLLAVSCPGIKVIHLAGQADTAMVRDKYRSAGLDAEVHAFLKEMETAYGGSSLAICRSGAASCAELALYGVPALFIPLPSAMRDHQTANAASIASRGGADVLAEKGLTPQQLCDKLAGMLNDKSRLDAMRVNMKNISVADAAGRLADLVEHLA